MSIARTACRAAGVLVAVLLLGSAGTAVARVPSAVECLALASDLPGTATTQAPAAWVAALPVSVRMAVRGRAAQELLVGIGPSRTLIVSRALVFTTARAARAALPLVSRTRPTAADALALGVSPAQARLAGRRTWRWAHEVMQLVWVADPATFGPVQADGLEALISTRVFHAIDTISEWQAVLARAASEPRVTEQTAMQAFALAFGPLPGVSVPRTDHGDVGSGDPAIDWLLAYWPQLTRAQRAAATVALRRGWPHVSAPVHGARLPAEQQGLSRQADGYAREYASRLRLAPTFQSYVFTKAFAFGARGPIAVSYGFDAAGGISGIPTRCVIQLNPRTTTTTVAEALAREVFHCFQMQILGSMLRLAPVAADEQWLTGGGAVWATCEVEPGLVGQGWYGSYLDQRASGLFGRSFDAIGFFSELEQATTLSPFATMAAALTAGSDTGSYEALVGTDEEQLLDDWAASYADDAKLGPAWTVGGPCRPDQAFTGSMLSLGPTTVSTLETLPLAATLRTLELKPGSYLVTVHVSSGRVRLSAPGIDDVIAPADGDQSYCVGTCSCTATNEDGSRPKPLAVSTDQPDLFLALTGDLGAGEATVTDSVVASCP